MVKSVDPVSHWKELEKVEGEEKWGFWGSDQDSGEG